LLGLAFEVRPTDAPEQEQGDPVEVARENARRKAVAARARPGETVLAVDTVVATGSELWGKPVDERDAARTLRALSGRGHRVVSGFALASAGAVEVGHETTEVRFRALDEPTIAWYVASGEWRGRAGGYAIQGRGGALVQRIEGDYLNVVGLPVAALDALWPAVVGRDG
jgi:septum formation protein